MCAKNFGSGGHVLLASAFQDSGERVSRGVMRSCGPEMHVKVEEAMQEGVSWCGPETTIAELARIMRDDDVGVIAISQNDKLIGMVTDRDLACRALADGEDASLLMARDVMTKGVVFCRSDQDVEEAIHIMEAQRVRRLPVVNEKGEMVGLLALENICAKLPPRLSHDAIKVLSAQGA